MTDEMGDRMKSYEGIEAGRKLIPLLPIVARLDGRSFSKFTAGLKRPYDERLSRLMVATTKHLVEETNALVGYTQSDEISLIMFAPDWKQQVWFDGKVQKMVSNLASQASAFFNKRLAEHLPEKANLLPTFDCRVWNVPSKDEAVNAILWREIDATKNSVSMATRHYYSHLEMENQGRAAMMEMLFKKGVNWNDYPPEFKRGSYVQRVKSSGRFTAEELDLLPYKHAARFNPLLEVERSMIVQVDMPPLSKVVNRVEVIFDGAKPKTAEGLAKECHCVGLMHVLSCESLRRAREVDPY